MFPYTLARADYKQSGNCLKSEAFDDKGLNLNLTFSLSPSSSTFPLSSRLLHVALDHAYGHRIFRRHSVPGSVVPMMLVKELIRVLHTFPSHPLHSFSVTGYSAVTQYPKVYYLRCWSRSKSMSFTSSLHTPALF